MENWERISFPHPMQLHQFYKVISKTEVWIRPPRKQPRMPIIPLSYIAKKIVRNQHHTVATSVDYGF